jgi:hypothetical protein
LAVEVDKGIEEEYGEYGTLERYFKGIVLPLEDDEVHEGIAQQKNEPVPHPRALDILEDIVGGREGRREDDGSGRSVVEGVDDVGFGFEVALLHGEAFDHLAGLFDDVVVLLAGVGVDGLVLFGGLHYKHWKNR